MLKSKDFTKEVQEDLKYSRTIGVSGVPHISLNGKKLSSGAGEAKMLYQAFLKC
jgi:predicted DsbA family dithiol-disulfide isomerase